LVGALSCSSQSNAVSPQRLTLSLPNVVPIIPFWCLKVNTNLLKIKKRRFRPIFIERTAKIAVFLVAKRTMLSLQENEPSKVNVALAFSAIMQYDLSKLVERF
jgi:uncharacterized membrane protein YoaK (UPF0700 family)